MDIYTAKMAGHNFLYEDYAERFAITWPCGQQTKLRSQSTLYDLGDTIAKHLDECKECK